MSWRKITGPCSSHIGVAVRRSMRESAGRRLYECNAKLAIQYLHANRVLLCARCGTGEGGVAEGG
eukprot:12540476-Prorocentrum_lima.AAC.1